MTAGELKAALAGGGRVYGTLVLSTSPKWLKYVGMAGLDFVFFDTEHAAVNPETLSWMCYAYGAAGLAPIVRISAPDPYAATHVLDAGAAGIIAPYIETADQVRALVGAIKHKPVKGAKLQAMLCGEAPFEPQLERYLSALNADTILWINLESCAAIDAIESILSVPGLDGVVIGPHDLSCSLGVPEQYTHPDFERAVRLILGQARHHGVAAGMHFMGVAEHEIRWAREAGLNLIIHNADLHSFVRTVRGEIGQIRAAFTAENG